METITELYRPEDLERLERKLKRSIRAALLLAAAALALCVFFCLRANTANALRMERMAIAVSTAAGWVVIWLAHHRIAELRRERKHAEMLMTGERSALEGELELSEERMRIRGSILFYPLKLRAADGTAAAGKVIAACAPTLRRQNGKRLRLYVVNGYAAAFECL